MVSTFREESPGPVGAQGTVREDARGAPAPFAAGLRQLGREVRVWDPVTGEPVGAPLTGHTMAVYSVGFGYLELGEG